MNLNFISASTDCKQGGGVCLPTVTKQVHKAFIRFKNEFCIFKFTELMGVTVAKHTPPPTLRSEPTILWSHLITELLSTINISESLTYLLG